MRSSGLVANLDKLPNELLYMIMSYIGDESHLPKKFRIAFILSLVSRRLREFAVSLLYQDVRLSYRQFESFQRSAAAKENLYTSYVRSLSVPGSDSTDPFPKVLMNERICFPFPSLRSLELLERPPPNDDIIASLQSLPLLESLALIWRAEWPFPEIAGMTRLCTLRLRVCKFPTGLGTKAFANHQQTISSLTTLHITHIRDRDYYELSGLSFPNLSVLNARNAGIRPWQMFNFVRSHPSLLEVNLSFGMTCRLEAILKLIDGTGVWYTSQNKDALEDPSLSFYINSEGVRVDLDIIEIDFNVPRTWADDIPNTRYASESFAFKRVPFDSLTMDTPPGARRPKYQATEFAIILADQMELVGDHTFAHFHEFFELAPRFPGVEVLRIRSRTPIPLGYACSDYFNEIWDRLALWTLLKKVSLCFLADENDCIWAWHDLPLIEPAIWDYGLPPSERWPSYEMYRNLECLRKDHLIDDAEKLQVIESAQHSIDMGQDLSEPDRAYLMGLWQMKNEPQLTNFMRHIASKYSPSLDEVDWYPVGEGAKPRTLWRWKFEREIRDGVSKVKRVHNYLTWKGCAQGDPDPMVALVGQEWEHFKDPKRRGGWRLF